MALLSKKGNVCLAQNISKKETWCKTLFKHAVANLAYWNPKLLDVQHQRANKQVSVQSIRTRKKVTKVVGGSYRPFQVC
jgi:hypothetical protein